jgi:hypothetical protein
MPMVLPCSRLLFSFPYVHVDISSSISPSFNRLIFFSQSYSGNQNVSIDFKKDSSVISFF